MNFKSNYHNYLKQLVAGEISLHSLPKDWSEEERAQVRMHAISLGLQNPSIATKIDTAAVLTVAAGKNCENIVDVVSVPLGVVGPIHINSEPVFYIPLATTEGALVASAQRGIKALSLSDEVAFFIDDKGMTRAPVFVVKDISHAQKVIDWLSDKKSIEILTDLIKATSSHLTLLKMTSKLVGKNLFIKFFFDTEAAMGMNMVTIATEIMSVFLEEKFQISCVSLSGNGCVDKKPSWGTVVEGRGVYVQAEAKIPFTVLENVLKTDAIKMVEVVTRKNYVGGAAFGSMGFNAHFANLVAAFYLATGQDPAHVVEGSVGITTAEVVGDALYFSVTLPNVLMGVVGGGTSLPFQKRSLAMMGITKATRENKKLLVRNLAYAVMGGELSLLAALSSKSLARAHVQFGRGKNG